MRKTPRGNRTRIVLLAVTGVSLIASASAASAPSKRPAGLKSCGYVTAHHWTVHLRAHRVGCRNARRVYRADMNLRVPKGWVCSASLRRCYHGGFDSDHWITWSRGHHAKAASAALSRSPIPDPGRVVLGSKRFMPNGEGFGTVAPRTISNGGDLSGLITHVRWHHWGSRIALAMGRNYIFSPHGGYYRHPVRVRLKANKIGHCPGSNRRAYRKLHIRAPRKPGGRLGRWRSWSGSKSICKPPY